MATRRLVAAGLAAVSGLVALRAFAAQARAHEALVMRIIFQDCLGYVRHGRTPFGGLATRPASAAAKAGLPARMPNRERAVALLSPRYVACWGEDGDARHCYVGTVFAAVQAGSPALLGVSATRFLPQVTARAAAEGLTEAEVADAFSPLATSAWSEPGPGQDSGPQRRVSLSLIATTPPDASGVAGASLIVIGGPSGRAEVGRRFYPDRPRLSG